MIQLQTDYLVFETPSGKYPFPVALVVKELLGESSKVIPPAIFQTVVELLTQEFRSKRKRSVTLDELLQALVDLLRQIGYQVIVEDACDSVPVEKSVVEQGSKSSHRIINLEIISRQTEEGGELLFYNRLKEELRSLLAGQVDIVELRGLRACVKKIARRKRWCPTCRLIEKELLSFLQSQFISNAAGRRVLLIVR